ncbi:hypothetical protein [Pseudophaeobacter sp.]|uniref:hypothetical protein n=1 Tax=Pseudophaeobacter sp. TaxID=1971739 RepID=UPI0032983F5B
MTKTLPASIAVLFLFSSGLHADTRAEKMFAKDVGAMVGLAEVCDLGLSDRLKAVKEEVLIDFPQDFEATMGFGKMAVASRPTLCDEAPELLEEFEDHLSDRE